MATRYVITSRPFYTIDSSTHYSDDDGDDVRIGDVLIVEDGEQPDGDGDLFGRIERTGSGESLSLAGCLTPEADVLTAEVETVPVAAVLEALRALGASAVHAETIVALAQRRAKA